MTFADRVQALDHFLWGPGTLALLLGTGAVLLLRTRFLPWRNLGWALRSALGQESRTQQSGGVSPFSALMTALAATIGTGNIVGVATALTAGGPGALVWMEAAALLGLSTKFAECMLAVKFRLWDRDGAPFGGPMIVLRDGLGGRLGTLLGGAFALFAVCASFGIGSMTQANSIAAALNAACSIPASITGLVTACLALTVILGGIRSISKVSAAIVPAMAVFYLAAGLLVILGNWRALPAALGTIFRCAFSPQAAAGGALGTVTALEAARWGVARGVFSNEAGLGSAAISAASAATDSPVRQGYISMTAVLFDTLMVCTVTGLAICASGALGTTDSAGVPVDGAALTILAFQSVLGRAGGMVVSVSVVLFAFTSILGWGYQGETACAYLLGSRSRPLFRAAFSLAALLGAAAPLETVFQLSDICNALMCLPNLVGLLLLSGTVSRDILAFQPEIHRKR